MNVTTFTGIAASVFTATSLVPQLMKLMREKKAEDISLAMVGVLFMGLALWVCYGWMIDDWIIIISNGFSLMINAAIAFFALKYAGRNR